MKDHCFAPCDASGLAVGLPEGVMGNSEVGHLTIGAGQAQYQDLVRINLALKDGSFRKAANLVVRTVFFFNNENRIHDIANDLIWSLLETCSPETKITGFHATGPQQPANLVMQLHLFGRMQ